MNYENIYRERNVTNPIETLSNEFQFISDVETKCINIKARIDMMKSRIGYKNELPNPIHVVSNSNTRQKEDLGDIRSKLKPKANTVEDEMKQVDAELDRALKKALAMN